MPSPERSQGWGRRRFSASAGSAGPGGSTGRRRATGRPWEVTMISSPPAALRSGSDRRSLNSRTALGMARPKCGHHPEIVAANRASGPEPGRWNSRRSTLRRHGGTFWCKGWSRRWAWGRGRLALIARGLPGGQPPRRRHAFVDTFPRQGPRQRQFSAPALARHDHPASGIDRRSRPPECRGD